MKVRKRSRKGFLIVEATLFLPIFLIGVLTLACLIPMMAIEERVMDAYTAEAAEVSKMAYLTTLPQVSGRDGSQVIGASLSQIYLEQKVRKRIAIVEARSASPPELKRYRYLYEENGLDGLIAGDISYSYRIPFPIRFYGELEFNDRLVFRGLIGSSIRNGETSFDDVANAGDNETVVIFPRNGMRYHSRECSAVTVYPLEVCLTRDLMHTHDPCKLCDPENLPLGSIVYCFTAEGKVYHRGSCSTVTKYVMEVEKEKALCDGYTPCQLCGG